MKQKTQSDASALAAVVRGHAGAFEYIVRRHQRRLYAIAYRILHNHERAQDAVQEAFVSLYTHVESVDPVRDLSPYLSAIVRNRAISIGRGIVPNVRLSGEEPAHERDLPDAPLMENETRGHIARSLESIGPKYSRVIRMYYYDGMTYERIGKILRIPVNTVRTHLRRAKRLLAGRLSYE